MKRRVLGVGLDAQSRCAHWHSAVDVVAMRFKCCGEYYGCRACHDETAEHPVKLWSEADAGECVAMCGVCGFELTMAVYLAGHPSCPACAAAWNPRCVLHRHLYFETPVAGRG